MVSTRFTQILQFPQNPWNSCQSAQNSGLDGSGGSLAATCWKPCYSYWNNKVLKFPEMTRKASNLRKLRKSAIFQSLMRGTAKWRGFLHIRAHFFLVAKEVDISVRIWRQISKIGHIPVLGLEKSFLGLWFHYRDFRLPDTVLFDTIFWRCIFMY